jgi:predicted amidohydrolase YtcJ
VTAGAAEVIGRAQEIGSIRAGKRADFVVLAEDPMTVPADALRSIEVEATIFSGTAYPIP